MTAAAADRASRPDLKNPDLYVDSVPYDLFGRLRREEPVFWNPETDGAGFWSVLRQADIVEVSRQPELFSSANKNGGHRIFNEHEVGLTGAGDAAIGVPFISVDPPLHNQYRRLIAPALAPGRLGDIENRVEQRTVALLDKIPMGESIDIVGAFAAPLPLLTLAELMDVPAEKWTDLYRWANAFVGEDDPDFRQSPESMQATVGEFFGFTQDLFERRRAAPGPDVASLLANAELEGRPITFAEFVGNMILVLVGGNETTRNAISHAIVEFAAHPDQWDLIRRDPGLLRTAAPEIVRHASPVMHMRRTATADTAIGGQKIAKGDKVVLWYSSGNRDESVYDDPNRFDVTRERVQHVGFGTGQHVCVGARLAELELQVVFKLLAPRVARFEVNGAPRRLRSNFINGLKQLNVTLVPDGGAAA